MTTVRNKPESYFRKKKPSLVPDVPRYNLGGTIGSGIGAVAGSVIPGIGTAVGSAAGGALGTVAGELIGGDEEKKRRIQKSEPEINYVQNKSMGQNQNFYAHGGNINKMAGAKTSYETEGGEIIEGENPLVTGQQGNLQKQTDDTYKVQGPSHEEGGVEGKGGERVFSDSLKIPGTKMTYADAAQKIVTKSGQKKMEKKAEQKPYDNILNQSLQRTEQRNEAEKDMLFNLQERMKNKKQTENGDIIELEEGGETDKNYLVDPDETESGEGKYPVDSAEDIKDAWRLRNHAEGLKISKEELHRRIKEAAEKYGVDLEEGDEEEEEKRYGGNLDEMKKGGWIQKATKKMEQKGTKGSLTQAAKNTGYSSAMQYARHIKSNPSNYSGKMRKKAAFAINANKKYGGKLPEYQEGGILKDAYSGKNEIQLPENPDATAWYDTNQNIPSSPYTKPSVSDFKDLGKNVIGKNTTGNAPAYLSKTAPAKIPRISQLYEISYSPVELKNMSPDVQVPDTVPQEKVSMNPDPPKAIGSDINSPARNEEDMSPFGEYLSDELESQQKKAGTLETVGRAAQTVPYIYNMISAQDKDYIPEQRNREAKDAIQQLRKLPTEYNIQPQMNDIEQAYEASVRDIGRYSVSPTTTRANVRQNFANRINQESRLAAQKINKENQMEAKKRRALSNTLYKKGTQAAKFRDQKNLRDARVDAAQDRAMSRGVRGLSNVAAGIAAQENKELRGLQRLAMHNELTGDTGVTSRMMGNPAFKKWLKENYPDQYKQFQKTGTITGQ